MTIPGATPLWELLVSVALAISLVVHPCSAAVFSGDCAYTAIDLAFVVDRSGSISSAQWIAVGDFIRDATKDFTIGQDNTR